MNDPEETRTLDLRRDRAALQPTEPPGQENIKLKWTFGDSNPGPTGYEPVALTN